MIRRLSPKSVRVAVNDGMFWAVNRAVYMAVSGAVEDAVYGAVHRAVYNAVEGSVWDAVCTQPTSFPSPSDPNLDRLVGEIRRARGSVR